MERKCILFRRDEDSLTLIKSSSVTKERARYIEWPLHGTFTGRRPCALGIIAHERLHPILGFCFSFPTAFFFTSSPSLANLASGTPSKSRSADLSTHWCPDSIHLAFIWSALKLISPLQNIPSPSSTRPVPFRSNIVTASATQS